MRIQCPSHSVVVGIKWNNTEKATSKVYEIFCPVPLRMAGIASELLNMWLNTLITLSSERNHLFACHHLENPLNRCIIIEGSREKT